MDDNGVAVDLTGATVKFKARAVGSTTLAIDASATIVGAATLGNVRYDWVAGDITGSGLLASEKSALVWWEVTSGGKTQDVMEALIEVRAHSPQANSYVELEELKQTLSLTGQSFADRVLQDTIVASSRAVDDLTHRRFWPDADATQVRYYTPNGCDTLPIDDVITLTSVTADYDGDGTFEQTWVENTDFVLEPLNAVADGYPRCEFRRHPRSGFLFSPYPRSLKVTAKFGWNTAPSGVKIATSMIATRMLTVVRSAPLGVVALGEVAMRVSRTMPDVELALSDYVKVQVLA